ncbi:glycosyltransferase [Butyrivibrio sp. CB08]|uniref:glycosyltransferase family 2 protein n=1 Tax=Butyrivibrio sp. CB08 TaxID=2364879 RepID=UPI000EA8A728|nr:glycosyltransferase family 2 protein [Butyrivibrio sp. CB08]RKM59792.1 glycosyltransferase [Butyrivibrio sp. CB08]
MTDNREKIVSFIIPVYQAKDTLKTCVLSCLNQKFVEADEMEVILVDDGSTDGSSEICDELQSQYDGRIQVIHGRNHGVSHARNIGIERATGRFLVFVDADDEVKETFIDNMTKYADEGTVIVDETKKYVGAQKLSGYQYIENSVLNQNTHVWGKLFDRQTIVSGNIRFNENLTIGEDLIFLIDLALSQERNHTIRCITEEDYIYNDNPNGAMKSIFKESYMDEFVCWRMAGERLVPHKRQLSEYAFVSLSASQIMTALLVVGKVAVWGKDERDDVLADLAVSEATEQISRALKTRGAFAGLPFGYKIKVILFRISPKLYLDLYYKHKKG